MGDDNYYRVLDVSESATQSEIKTAYRRLMKKIHPDTVSTLSPEVRRLSADVTKEIITAYSVLSDATKRREYDRRLAEFRQRSAPIPTAAPGRPSQPVPTRSSRGSYNHKNPDCRKCGARLDRWGSCHRCERPYRREEAPKSVVVDNNWHKVKRWAANILVLAPWVTFFGWYIVIFVLSVLTPNSNNPCLPSQKIEVNGHFVCPQGVQPDLSRLTDAESKSIRAACHNAAIEGPAPYEKCLDLEFRSWEEGPKQPELSRLTDAESNSIQAACSNEYLNGPATYDRCLGGKLEAWEKGPKQPDLSHLEREKQKSIESACSDDFMQGPAPYNRCLIRLSTK